MSEKPIKQIFFSIMVDDICDISTTEQMTVAIRYLRTNNGSVAEVTENFLGFIQLKETNAEGITDALLSKLGKRKVNLTKWRGKGFDGNPRM